MGEHALPLPYLRRPASVPSDRPPLLLLLHGVGSNERSMIGLAQAFDPRAEVLAVRSPIALGPDAYAWFHVQFTPTGPVIDAAEAQAGWTLLARFIDEAVAAFGADPARAFVGGFSQGGIVSLAGLLAHPERIAGALVMSGRLLPEVLPHAAPAEALRGKPLMILHGVDDAKLGIHFARQARERLAPFGLDLEYHELPMGHEVRAESVALAARWFRARIDGTARG